MKQPVTCSMNITVRKAKRKTKKVRYRIRLQFRTNLYGDKISHSIRSLTKNSKKLGIKRKKSKFSTKRPNSTASSNKYTFSDVNTQENSFRGLLNEESRIYPQ